MEILPIISAFIILAIGMWSLILNDTLKKINKTLEEINNKLK